VGGAINNFTVEALRDLARRRTPRVAFDYLNGGAGDESALRLNLESFTKLKLVPRVMINTTQRSAAHTLFGEPVSMPLGVAPIGLANFVWPGADKAIAKAAAQFGIPYILSSAASTSIEEIITAAPKTWFQLYVGSNPEIVDDLIDRAADAGCSVLVVTADVAAPGKRIRDLVNGFTLPLKPTVRGTIDLARHPRWCMATVRAGAPRFANLEKYGGVTSSALSLAALQAAQISGRLDWQEFSRLRGRWRGRLLLKGVMDTRDARRAIDLGADGIILSNHGGRQLSSAPSPLDLARQVRRAIGSSAALILDGGVRSGEDICKALALGADFVLMGRPFVYAVAALGLHGPSHLLKIVHDELSRAMAQLGACSIPELADVRIIDTALAGVSAKALSEAASPGRISERLHPSPGTPQR